MCNYWALKYGKQNIISTTILEESTTIATEISMTNLRNAKCSFILSKLYKYKNTIDMKLVPTVQIQKENSHWLERLL